MPSESAYPKLPIPDVDLWAFLFERKDRPFGDDKGSCSRALSSEHERWLTVK